MTEFIQSILDGYMYGAGMITMAVGIVTFYTILYIVPLIALFLIGNGLVSLYKKFRSK